MYVECTNVLFKHEENAQTVSEFVLKLDSITYVIICIYEGRYISILGLLF